MFLSCFDSGMKLLNTDSLSQLLLLAVAKTSIKVLDLRLVKKIEVLIATESELSKLILEANSKLRVV